MKERKPDKAFALVSQVKGHVWVSSIRRTRREVVQYANTVAPWPWPNASHWKIKPINLLIETVEKKTPTDVPPG
jgi:hypothetical protein